MIKFHRCFVDWVGRTCRKYIPWALLDKISNAWLTGMEKVGLDSPSESR